MSERIQVGVNGAAGRMGQRIVALTFQDPELYVGAALEAADNPEMGRDVGEIAGIGSIGMPVTAELRGNVDVIIDFSTPDGLIEIAEICAERHIGLVAATTGLSEQQQSTVAEVAHVTPVLMAPNLSVAVNLTMKLVRDAAIALKGVAGGVDVEIIERHHRFKEDAPSGTALRFGEIVAEQMGQTEHVHGRQGRPGPRPQTEIGYHSLRTGDNVGEHLIVFGLMGETIDISVRGHTRDSYAYGALAAAKFLVNKPPALYSMSDVLGF
jgi:4-hydroxy-tetrahydrodipicolinate reductase